MDKYQFLKWVRILIENWMTSQRLAKGLNKLVKMLITFNGFYLKNYWFESVFSRCKKKQKHSLQTNYYNNLLKLYFINKLKHLSFLSIWTLQRLEALSFQLLYQINYEGYLNNRYRNLKEFWRPWERRNLLRSVRQNLW